MKAAFILPYFGRFSDLFPFYLQSCGKNPDITWLIFSDNDKPEYCPDNVHFIKTEFLVLRNRIQAFYDFPISLENPYKLCDFKPAYGEIFSEYLTNYDYWGYCDCDLLWGNIQKIIDCYMGKYDQIGSLGHCTLYRNEQRLTDLYRKNSAYKMALGNPYSLFFDEIGFQTLLRKGNFSCAPNFELGDFHPRHFAFDPVVFCGNEGDIAWQQIFEWKTNGTLLRYHLQHGELATNEIYYIHFLKRKMTISPQLKLDENLLIIPNQIAPCNLEITPSMIIENSRKRFYKEYWRSGLTLKQIQKKLIQRFSLRRRILLKKISSIAENS